MSHDAYKEVEALKGVLSSLSSMQGLTVHGRTRIIRFALSHFDMLPHMREHLCHRPECQARATGLLEAPAIESPEADHGKLLANYAVKDAELRRALDRVAELERQLKEDADETDRVAGATDEEWVTAESYEDWLSESHEKFVAMGKEFHEDWAAQARAALQVGGERIADLERQLAERSEMCRKMTDAAEQALKREAEYRAERDEARKEAAYLREMGRAYQASDSAQRRKIEALDHGEETYASVALERAKDEPARQPETLPAPPMPDDDLDPGEGMAIQLPEDSPLRRFEPDFDADHGLPDPEPESAKAEPEPPMPAKRGGLTADEAMEAMRAGWVTRDKEGDEWRWHEGALQILCSDGEDWGAWRLKLPARMQPYSIERRA